MRNWLRVAGGVGGVLVLLALVLMFVAPVEAQRVAGLPSQYGQGLMQRIDAAAARTYLGVGSAGTNTVPAAGVMVSSNGVITSTQGTAGYFPYWGPSGTRFGTTNLVFTDGVNLGIGTNVPGYFVHIVDTNVNWFPLFIEASNTANNRGVNLLSSDRTANSLSVLRYSLSDDVGATIAAGAFIIGKEQLWTATSSTRDSFFAFYTSLDGNYGERLRLTSGGNLLLGTTTAGTSLAKGFVMGNGTAPTTFPADIWQGWGADIAGAGDAGLNLRGEGANAFYRFGTNAFFGGALTVTNKLTIGVDAGNATAISWSAGNSATLDFGSIATLSSADLTITVTGAAVGDTVSLGLPAAPAAGIAWDAFVSAANTVTVRANNYTALSVDPASASYSVRLFRN